MTIDLDAERAASQERVDEQTRGPLLDGRARRLRGLKGWPSYEAAAENEWRHFTDEQRAEIVARAKEMDGIQGGRDLATDEVMSLARAFLDENRDATSTDVWEHVCSKGRPSLSRSSFPSYLSKVRKALGIDGRRAQVRGGKKGSGRRSAPPAPAPTPTPEPDDQDYVPKLKEEPAPEPIAAPDVATDNQETDMDQDDPTTPADEILHDGSIEIERGGDRFRAELTPGGWRVSYEATMTDAEVGVVLRRFLESSREEEAA